MWVRILKLPLIIRIIIVYLYLLAEEALPTYTKLALKKNGLQNYIDAINEFN